MKWLLLAAVVVAAFLAARILLSDVRRAGRRSTLGSLLAAVVSLAVLAAVLSLAHFVGLASIAIVAVAFVPFGLLVRWSLLETRGRRDRYEAARPAAPIGLRGRAARAFELPMLIVLAVGAMALGATMAIVASWR
jgi:hypothetical protein